MIAPTMLDPYQVSGDTWILPSYLPVPGAGILPVNAFLIMGREPILIDTGVLGLREPFMRALQSIIDLDDLRWIWITHADADHVGNLPVVLQSAPQARVVTSFLGFAKLGLLGHDVPNFFLLNPGQTLRAGNRELVAVPPPVFDAPETAGAFDPQSGILYSADCFGALMREPAQTASDITPDALREGMITWSTVDSPWLHRIDRRAFGASLDTVRSLGATAVFSGHLPPAHGITEDLLRNLALAPDAEPFVGPDQDAFERMMTGMTV